MKKTIVPHEKLLKALAELSDLHYDDGSHDNRLFYETDHISVFASAMTEKEYIKMQNLINSKEIKGKGYTVYAWNDVSGYEYWNDDDESNYIQITACITDLNKIDPDKLKSDAQQLFDFFHRFNNYEKWYIKKNNVG